MGVIDGEGAACPAYPWPQDGAQRGRKVFMQSDCAACHSMLPYAGLRDAAPAHSGEVEPKVAEILVANVTEEQQPALTTTTVLEGLRRHNLYTAQDLRNKTMALPAPVCLQFLLRAHNAA